LSAASALSAEIEKKQENAKVIEAGIALTIFFYNPNIHPKKEYEIRHK
jgi:predicted adenine nucleotide alpha hydrolase (AANH) superfamily ATPase